MTRKLLLSALLAAGLALPGVASAHVTRGEIRHDKRVVHHEHRELARARHNGNWDRAHHERRELASARRELHHDRHAWRHQHRHSR